MPGSPYHSFRNDNVTVDTGFAETFTTYRLYRRGDVEAIKGGGTQSLSSQTRYAVRKTQIVEVADVERRFRAEGDKGIVGQLVVLKIAGAEIYTAQLAIAYGITEDFHVGFCEPAAYGNGINAHLLITHQGLQRGVLYIIAADAVETIALLYFLEAGIGGIGRIGDTGTGGHYENGV